MKIQATKLSKVKMPTMKISAGEKPTIAKRPRLQSVYNLKIAKS
jgi:hypothetical protein